MNILQKLSKIAESLDAKGLYLEANVIDNIIKESIDFSNYTPGQYSKEQGQSIHNFEKGTEINVPYTKVDFQKGIKIRGRRRYLATMNKLRRELGLGPGMFDKQVAMVLRKYYPGVWQPGQRQKASDILAAVQQKKQQTAPDTGMAIKQHTQQQPTPMGQPRVTETGQTAHLSDEDLFPKTLPPDISLGPKKEYPIEMP